MTTTNPRMIRGFSIVAQHGQIRQLEAHTFKVKSQSGNGQYVITNGKAWDCSCPDHAYRKLMCKHIFAVKFWVSLKEQIDKADFFQLYRELSDASTCGFCGSVNIIKWGYRKNKNVKMPRFKCKDCGQTFVVDEGFARMRFNPKVIALSLDLYFKGISLRKIAHHIKQFYGLRISQMGIYKWLQKYGKIINNYVDQLEPELSDVWHTDEMKIKCGGKWTWLWNVMDSGTRYLLATHISQTREIGDARKVFQKAKNHAKDKPQVMVTDGLKAYMDAFRKEFYTLRNPRTRHLRKPRFTDLANNNMVERLNGTVREREKVMRGLKTEETAKTMTDFYRAYYNLIRPHEALDGKTPSEQAGIGIASEGNKWLSLIKTSTKK